MLALLNSEEIRYRRWQERYARILLMLQMDQESLKQAGIGNILPGIDWSPDHWDGGRLQSDNVLLQTGDSTRYCSLVAVPLNEYGYHTLAVTMRKQKHLINLANKISGNRAVYTFRDYITTNESMKNTLALAATFARYEGNILILGESGTGKELLAQAIHNAGANAGGPFVAVNCASIPRELFEMELFGYEAGAFPGKVDEGKPGRFELAQNGTLFLDEVSAMPIEMQIKLLRAVETHRIQRLGSTQEIQLNIRIIASSNQNLPRLIERGDFRRDMYYRLSALKLEIPPLRERPEDIILCAERFLQSLNESSGQEPKAMSRAFREGLMEYDWPGNIRQLQNSIARAYYGSSEPELTAEDLARSLENFAQVEKAPAVRSDTGEGGIVAALTVCGGDVQAAAERLGMSRATLYRRMKQYGISPRQIRRMG